MLPAETQPVERELIRQYVRLAISRKLSDFDYDGAETRAPRSSERKFDVVLSRRSPPDAFFGNDLYSSDSASVCRG